MVELYHLGVPAASVPELALLVDPQLTMAPALAPIRARPLAARREYMSHIGALHGQEILVTSIGVGAPPLAIALEELSRAGARSFVLLATGTMPPDPARWLLPYGAARGDGTSAQYAPLPFPAVPDPWLRARLFAECAGAASYGLVESVDVLDPAPVGDRPVAARDTRCAALFVVAAARGVRAAALLVDSARAASVDDDESTIGGLARAAYRALASVGGGEGGAVDDEPRRHGS